MQITNGLLWGKGKLGGKFRPLWSPRKDGDSDQDTNTEGIEKWSYSNYISKEVSQDLLLYGMWDGREKNNSSIVSLRCR